MPWTQKSQILITGSFIFYSFSSYEPIHPSAAKNSHSRMPLCTNIWKQSVHRPHAFETQPRHQSMAHPMGKTHPQTVVTVGLPNFVLLLVIFARRKALSTFSLKWPNAKTLSKSLRLRGSLKPSKRREHHLRRLVRSNVVSVLWFERIRRNENERFKAAPQHLNIRS